MILLIDNYDSFVYNLARYFRRLGQATGVVRNTAIDAAGVRRMGPQLIVLSPGPGTPEEAGCCLEVVDRLHREFPILGICLGHQAVARALGAEVVRSSEPMHGRASLVRHDRQAEFKRLPTEFPAGRYHSLVVQRDSLPACLEVSAWAEDGTVMAVRHRELPVAGWQFHPESVLTAVGYRLLDSLLGRWGLETVGRCPSIEGEVAADAPGLRSRPSTPIAY
jgi:anthranilate synthase/aminodeoxychorismate synthase-like glutamine amidotransferase